jgi:para-aminobenzoate synthetase/4-amino-4-deoxychorismate lyase
MSISRTPFVLLDDARETGATLFRDPVGMLRADRMEEVGPLLDRLRAETAGAGLHAAGWLAYEAGCALEPRLAPRMRGKGPLAWFGLFAERQQFNEVELVAFLGDPAGAWAGQPRPRVDRLAYEHAVSRVQALIAAGDIYQANLSFRADVPVAGSPPALYARLRAKGRGAWSALLFDGERWLLSASPELFFETDGQVVRTRPMKGTAPRGASPAADEALADRLRADPKERAENLMIVDLLRNDLSRVAVPGTVAVPELFAVERYPTVQQMVSAVCARLAAGRDAVDLLTALFPCGSVTGAPKLRAMEVIAEVEPDARGPYTGAIGRIGPDGSAAFNVAIRTLAMDKGGQSAVMGLGSAVVADSTAAAEWRECLNKGAFVATGSAPDLLETMRFDPDEGLIELERHVARLGASAQALGFRFDRHGVRNELHTATFRLTTPARVRLRLAPGGAVAIETAPLPAPPPLPLAVTLVPLPLAPEDLRLRHKTADRSFYDDARTGAGTDEVLFVRADGHVTEGSFTSLFVERDGCLMTPPRAHGLQAGILRQQLLDEGQAVEAPLTREDLTHGFLVGNVLRGLMPARLA